MSMPPVRVRIAPSPTGDPHVGTAYMALFNQIFARHHGGKFIFRVEDTDQTRSRSFYEQATFDALHWCGIQWDEGPDVGGPFGPYRQSERLPLYKENAFALLQNNTAYKCFCTEEELERRRKEASTQGARGYDGRCRHLTQEEIAEKEQAHLPFVIRLKVPKEGLCEYEDAIKGKVSFPWADVDDQVLLKSDGFPTYHLANVVDDHYMEISHVIRGDEWMSSTPKHILLYRSFGWQPPIFMHMPLLLGKDGRKLSKRRNPTSIFFYRDSGYLPEAFCNFLTLMGYSMPEDKEIYSIEEMVTAFDVRRIGVSGAVFEIQKLDWLNQQYLIRNIPENQLWSRIKNWGFQDAFMEKLMPLCHPRIKTFGEFMELFDFLFINHLKYLQEDFAIKGLSHEQSASLLQLLIFQLDAQEDWSGEGMKAASHEIATKTAVHHKKQLMPLLFASLMGKSNGPPLFDSVTLLGKDRTRARLLGGMDFLGGVSNKKLALLKKKWDLQESLAVDSL